MGLLRRLLGHPYANQAGTVPGEGVGPDGIGSAPIGNVAFPSRGAPLGNDDLNASRPLRKAASGFVGVQLDNGRGRVTSLRRDLAVRPVFRAKTQPAPRRVLPGDRLMVPPSPGQVAGWMAAGAGAQGPNVTGNGSVVAGLPLTGGTY